MAAVATAGGSRGNGQYTELVTVTPEMALKWLEEANLGNRSPSERYVNTLARDILSGNWEVDGNAIRFSKSGRLLDGQHRLLAIVQADRPVETFVAYNLKDKAMTVIDRGKARSIADLFKINLGADRVSAAGSYSAIVNTISRIERNAAGEGVNSTLSYAEASDIFNRYEHDIRWAFEQVGHKIEPNAHSGGGPVMGAFAFARAINKDKLEAFAFQFKHGEPVDGRSKMSPAARALRQIITSKLKGASNQLRLGMMVRTLRGIEAFLDGEDLTVIKMDAGVIDRMKARRQQAVGRR
jgi:hypothetical protein